MKQNNNARNNLIELINDRHDSCDDQKQNITNPHIKNDNTNILGM